MNTLTCTRTDGTPEHSNVVETAMRIAVRAHAGQTRKDGCTPYIEHPMGVAAILIEYGYGPDTIAAGLLHDVLEDTDWTAEHLRTRVGPTVTLIVEEASEPDKSLPWRARKEHTLATLREKSLSALRVIAADKLHNMRSLLRDIEMQGDVVWSRFNRVKTDQAWYYRSMADQLEEAATQARIAGGLGCDDLSIDEPLFRALGTAIRAVFTD